MTERTALLGSDVQARRPSTYVSLSRVGVTGVEKVIRIRVNGDEQLFYAELECFVDLGPEQKGAHMSRFEEVVNEAIDEVILGEAFKAETLAAHIAERVRDRQEAGAPRSRSPRATRRHKPAPASGSPTQEIYTLFGVRGGVGARHAPDRGSRGAGHDRLPVRAGDGHGALPGAARGRTASPRTRSRACSRRSRWPPTTSAASARCTSAARRAARTPIQAETLLEIVEASMSSEIYELMKRSDEVEVVEKAHMHPRFVEDCVREMVRMATERFGRRRRRLHLRAPGEPRDDPQAQSCAERHGLLDLHRRDRRAEWRYTWPCANGSRARPRMKLMASWTCSGCSSNPFKA